MAKSLVIVESPAKSKTIVKYLGEGFEVLASFGHVRDLEPKNDAVDTEHNFTPRYELIERNKDKVATIKRAAKQADNIYLATDPDREGEAISWHILEILKEAGLTKGKRILRCTFTEITPEAVRYAVAHPREIIMDLVNAQQARRILDFLVGFNLSPVLWQKVQKGLSAGRVQSPALRLIVERNEEIEAFKPQEYWSLQAECSAKIDFTAKAVRLDGKKVEQFTLTDVGGAEAARQRVLKDANGALVVEDIISKERRRKPAPPFTTSTLQQEASRKLGFSTKRTMQAAQKLYEGFKLGSGESVGLITYMRTDSVHLNEEAVNDIRQLATSRYGKDYIPTEPINHLNKSKNAQEAHEGIRPTSVIRLPEEVAPYLDTDEKRLYELIWKRTMASQMSMAVLNTVSVDLVAGTEHTFRVSGTTVVFPGFLAVYEEGKDTKGEDDDDLDRKLPPLSKGERVKLQDVRTEQHFTQPPPRFTEAALVKALEEYGIGRPSTYATIISTLQNRGYVEMDGKAFEPTDVGVSVIHFLNDHFTQYVAYDFTAALEDSLDAVSRGERDWISLLSQFWGPFISTVKEKKDSVSRVEAQGGRELGIDPVSGRPVIARLSRNGPVIQIGTKDDEEKPRFASLAEGQHIRSITLGEALQLFQLPRNLGQYEGNDVLANRGRFGAYVKCGDFNVSMKKEDDPFSITLERAIELIRERKDYFKNLIIKEFPNSKIQVVNGKYGPAIRLDGKYVKVPAGTEPSDVTLEQAQEALANAPKSKFGGKKKFGKKFKK